MFDKSLYMIGWVCALRTELVAATIHLDEQHDSSDYEAAHGDSNTYVFGTIGKHYVVIATLPRGEYGTSSAASVARDMIRSFPNVRVALMVGIGGGAPLMDGTRKQDIRLGDVVVSTPGNGEGGVLQYDYGKTIQDQEFMLTGHLNSPPQSLLAAVNVLGAEFEINGNTIDEEVTLLLDRNKKIRRTYKRPLQATDRLFKSSFLHSADLDCSNCDPGQRVKRDAREEDEDIVIVHDGLIASANQLMKDASIRDKLARSKGVLCFEMEAAGLINQLPFLVIRGICDYSDTHKNKEWQGYAAMTAAAYAKKLLLKLAPAKVIEENKLGEIREIKAELQEVNSNLDGIRSDLLKYTNASLGDVIERWLAAPDPETNFWSSRNQREPGTGQWLMEFEKYRQWKSSTIRHLWLHGKAGCGKSVITTSIIEDVRSFCADDADVGSAIFYFTFSDANKQSYSDCLHSVVHQISAFKSVSSSLGKLYESSKKRHERGFSTDDGLQQILIDGIGSYKQFFLVLDALDESPEVDSTNTRHRERLLEWLLVLSDNLPMLKILATSRHLPDIQVGLSEMDFQEESMITHCVDVDISKYVMNQLNKDRRLRELSSEMKQDIQDTFVRKADGMFRWATCQINELKKLPSTRPSDLEKVLKNLPETLDDTYNRMINNIPLAVHHDALVLLRWLTYSVRPLNLLELSEARIISLETAQGEVAFHDRGRAEDVLEILSGLILVVGSRDTKSHHGDISEPGYKTVRNSDYNIEHASQPRSIEHRLVRLAHFSVREYLESTRPSADRPKLFYFQAEREHQFLCHCCVVYLWHYSGSSLTTNTLQDLEHFPLLQYTASSWFNHCQETDDVELEVLFLQSQAFWDSVLVHDPRRPSLPPFAVPTGSNIRGNAENASALYYAASLGLSRLCRFLIECGANVNAQPGHHRQPLGISAALGYNSIISMLIEAGADVNAPVMFGNRALDEAAYHGHDAIVRMLIEAGADVNAQNDFGRTALHGAASKGRDSILEMLIDAGANVNIQGKQKDTVLHFAAARGIASIVKLLIDAGADVDVIGEIHGSALMAASERGNAASVKLLIDAGSNVNAKGGNYGNALQAAANKGHESVVKLLIEAGADVNARGGNYGDALLSLATNGARGAYPGVIVNNPGGDNRSALEAAVMRRSQLMTRMLLDAGADPSSLSHEAQQRLAMWEGRSMEMLSDR